MCAVSIRTPGPIVEDSVTLSSTMGPGVRIDTTHIDVVVKH